MMRRKSTVAFGLALECDLHHAPFDRRGLVIALDVVAADHVQNNIRAFSAGRGLGRGNEIFALVVNGGVGAEAAARFAFLFRSRGRDDARAERLGQLDRGRADARRAAVNQQRLARREAGRARRRCARP